MSKGEKQPPRVVDEAEKPFVPLFDELERMADIAREKADALSLVAEIFGDIKTRPSLTALDLFKLEKAIAMLRGTRGAVMEIRVIGEELPEIVRKIKRGEPDLVARFSGSKNPEGSARKDLDGALASDRERIKRAAEEAAIVAEHTRVMRALAEEREGNKDAIRRQNLASLAESLSTSMQQFRSRFYTAGLSDIFTFNRPSITLFRMNDEKTARHIPVLEINLGSYYDPYSNHEVSPHRILVRFRQSEAKYEIEPQFLETEVLTIDEASVRKPNKTWKSERLGLRTVNSEDEAYSYIIEKMKQALKAHKEHHAKSRIATKAGVAVTAVTAAVLYAHASGWVDKASENLNGARDDVSGAAQDVFEFFESIMPENITFGGRFGSESITEAPPEPEEPNDDLILY